MENKTALVVGANGIIGKNLIEYLLTLNDWQIIGLSRRGGVSSGNLQYVAVDLLNDEDSKEKLQRLNTVTHIFYVAYQDRPTWAALVEPNVKMLKNVIDVIEQSSRELQHISLMQGYKVYGGHLGPFKTPAKESDPSHMPPEFNVDQQNYLEEKQKERKWTWSAIRPAVVGGTALGNPMNLALQIAVYASISKELGIPLRFPGKPVAYDKLLEMTDSSLLAKAIVWAATTPKCANQAFNINNGDLFRWNDMWSKIAAYFKMEVAPPLPISLSIIMADKEALWNIMMKKYGLEHSYEEVSTAWGFGDFVFSWDYDMFADGTKARRFGFHEFVDTEKMLINIFEDFRQRKVIP